MNGQFCMRDGQEQMTPRRGNGLYETAGFVDAPTLGCPQGPRTQCTQNELTVDVQTLPASDPRTPLEWLTSAWRTESEFFPGLARSVSSFLLHPPPRSCSLCFMLAPWRSRLLPSSVLHGLCHRHPSPCPLCSVVQLELII